VNVGILASGGGSNALALIKAMQSGDINANPALVLSNNSNAGVLQKSRDLSVATEVVDHRPFKGDRAAFDAEIGQTLAKHQIDVVCLAGFMRIMTEGFVRTWEGKMLNIHPSLLPKYTGLNTHQRAIDAGDTKAGCTVHMVIPELEAYYKALKAGGRPHFIGYYVLVMALQGRPWNDCRGKEKEALKSRFEDIKSRVGTQPKTTSAIERELDALGVRDRSAD